MASSQPPPPTTGSSTPYVIGAVVLALLAFGLYRWKASSATAQPQVTTVTATPTAEEVPVLNAPPPPPKVEEIPDAGDDAAAPTQPKTATGGGSGGCGGKCDNPASPALQSALRGAAQSAQGCYKRALRGGEVGGKMLVSVTVGPNGSVCGARIAQDEVHSGEVTSCVLSRFNGRQFPTPGNGCSTVQIPLNFVAKQ